MHTFNLTEYLLEKNQNNLEKNALIYIKNQDHIIKYKYKDLYEMIYQLSYYFSKKLYGKQKKILLRMPSNPDVIFYFLSTILLGHIPIPVSRMLTRYEIEYIIGDAGVNYIIYQDLELPEKLPDSVAVFNVNQITEEIKHQKYIKEIKANTVANDPAFIIYTSGSMGIPKGVIHAQRNILGRIPIQREWLDIKNTDVLFHAGELNWTYTLGVGVLDVFANSGTSILVGNGEIRENPFTWAWILNHFPVSIFATVPSLYRRILKYTSERIQDLKYLRHSLSAGESLKPNLWKQWTDITQKPLYEALGMTEISTYISSGVNVPTKPGSPGKPQKGRSVRIISSMEGNSSEVKTGDTGIIAVHKSDPGLMLGYTNQEEGKNLFRDDWFVTGDMAYKDEDGYYWFMGRDNDLMKSFGYRVSPLEVEKILENHPAIQDCCVCEVKKNEEISLITAFVVLKQDQKTHKQNIIDYCKEYLAEYKCPREVIFLDELPRTPSGKILRKQLQKNYNGKIG